MLLEYDVFFEQILFCDFKNKLVFFSWSTK